MLSVEKIDRPLASSAALSAVGAEKVGAGRGFPSVRGVGWGEAPNSGFWIDFGPSKAVPTLNDEPGADIPPNATLTAESFAGAVELDIAFGLSSDFSGENNPPAGAGDADCANPNIGFADVVLSSCPLLFSSPAIVPTFA